MQLGFYYTLLIEKEINCQKLTSNLLSNKTATNESLSGPNESMSWYLKCMIGLSDTCVIKDDLEHNNNIKSSGLFHCINTLTLTLSCSQMNVLKWNSKYTYQRHGCALNSVC